MPQAYGKPDVQRQKLAEFFQKAVSSFENLPGSLIKNVAGIPLSIPPLMDLLPFSTPVGPSGPYGINPGQTEELKSMMKGIYEPYLPENIENTLVEDPGRPILDLASLVAPFLKTAKGSGLGISPTKRLKNYIINKVGHAPEEIPAELLTDEVSGIKQYGGATQREIVEESQRRGIPLNWLQGLKSRVNAGFIESWLNPETAAIHDPLLEARNRVQTRETRSMVQELLDPTGKLDVLDEPGLTASKINKEVTKEGGIIEKYWNNIKTKEASVFGPANETIIPFTEERKVSYNRSGGQTGETVKDIPREVQGPIILSETYPIIEDLVKDLNVVENSFLNTPLVLSDHAAVIKKLKGLLENPSYKQLEGTFNIGDINILWSIKQNLNGLRNYVNNNMQNSGLSSKLSDLHEAIKNDIYNTFSDPHGHEWYKNTPDLGERFKNYIEFSGEELKKKQTSAYKYLGTEPWRGLNSQAIMMDPEKGIAGMMGSYNDFKHSSDLLGKDTSRQVLLADMFAETVDTENMLRGYDYKKIRNYTEKHKDKINLVMNTDQKHALSIWSGFVENQNKLNELQKAQSLFSTRKDQGVLNIVSGALAQRPGLLALGIVRDAQLIFSKKFLSKIASDTQAVYAAARLADTPYTHPSVITRTKNFIKILGKMNVVGKLNYADGTEQEVGVTSSGEIRPLDERSKPLGFLE